MKIIVRIILICLLFLPFYNQANAQWTGFDRKWDITSIDGVPTTFPVYTTLITKTPDYFRKGQAFLFEGNPTKEEVHKAYFDFVYPNYAYGFGQFYTQLQSTVNLDFVLEYGSLQQGTLFDKIVASTGDIGNESNVVNLEAKVFMNFVSGINNNSNVVYRYYYSFDRSQVYYNPETAHSKLLIFRYYKADKVVKTIILPIVITGTERVDLGDSQGPMELISILRKPPGNESYTQLKVDSEIKREISMSYAITDSETQTRGVSVNAGLKGVDGEVGLEDSQTFEETEGKANTYTASFKAGNTYTNTYGSDYFIIKQYQYRFSLVNNVAASIREGYLMVSGSNKIEMKLLNIPPDSWNRTEEGLLDEIRIAKDANNPALAKYFEDIIALNKKIKATAVNSNIKPEKVKGAYEKTFTSTTSKSETITQEVSLKTSKSIKAKVGGGFEIEEIGVEAGVEVSSESKWEVTTTTSNANTSATAKSKTVEYKISDEGLELGTGKISDILVTNIWEDPTFGTPIFLLDSGSSETSCPYEGGYQIDQPEIKVLDPITQEPVKTAKYSDLDSAQKVIFTLKLSNKSKYNRSYILKIPNTPYRPNVSTIDNLSEPFEIPAGESTTVDLTVWNKFTKETGFKDFAVIFSPDCDESVADTVLLSVFYGDTDANRPPDNNTVCNAVLLPVDGILQTTYINKFGNIANISNKNTYSVPEENILTPAPDCSVGWCPETIGGLAEITNSVWFKFAVVSPEIIISACDEMNAAFNAQMAVYKGSDCNDLNSFQQIAANDNGCTDQPLLPWIYLNNLAIGDTLYILVDGFQGAQSDFGLRLSSPAPQYDNACLYEVISVDGQPNHYYNYLATSQENEQLLMPKLTDPLYGWKSDNIQHSVWFAFVAPPGEAVIIDVENATFDSQVGLYGTEGNICGPEWFYTYENLASNDDASVLGGLDSRISYKGLTKGKRYLILVDGYQGATGDFDLRISIPTPKNDDPCDAISLENNAAFQGPYSNGGATSSTADQALAPSYSESGENGWTDDPANLSARQVEKSIWFTFVAPPSGKVEISTWNQTNFIAQLAVYEVGNCEDLASYILLGAEDNSHIRQIPPDNEYPNGHGVRGSILNLTDLVADSVYYIMVDGSMNDFGAFSIDILSAPPEPPINDEVCSAIELPVDGTIQGGFTNHGATVSTDEASVVPLEGWGDASMNSSVWFKFTAPSGGEVEISTCDLANFDTKLAVYSVTDCADFTSFTLVAANDDGPTSCSTNGDSHLPVSGLSAGQTYYIVVDGYANSRGRFSIVIRNGITPAPVNDEVVSAILLPVDGFVQTGFTNEMATATSNEQAIRPVNVDGTDCITGWCDDQVDNSVWFKFVAPSTGIVNISTCNLADFDTQLAVYETTDVSDFGTFTLIAANDAGPDDCATFFDSYLPVQGLTSGKTYYIMVDGFDGDYGSFDIVLSVEEETTSIPELNESDLFRIYPNPFDGIVHLEYSKSSQHVEYIQVKDISGRTVLDIPNLDQNPDGNIQIDLSTAPSGMLFLMIHTTEGKLINKKIIKY